VLAYELNWILYGLRSDRIGDLNEIDRLQFESLWSQHNRFLSLRFNCNTKLHNTMFNV
jgi:hypothetical protein